MGLTEDNIVHTSEKNEVRMYASTYVRMSNNPIPLVLISEKRMRSENSFLTDEDPGLGRNVSIK